MIKIAGFTGFILFLGTVLNAASVTYTYTGDAFTNYSGTYNSGAETNLSVSVTFASALGDNFSEAEVTPLSFQISDGSTILTNLSPDIDNNGTYFYLGTDGSGDIEYWDVDVAQTNESGYVYMLTEIGVDVSDACNAESIPGESCNVVDNASVEYAGDGGTQPQPGWTESAATPEPSTVTLAIMGGLLLLASRSRKSQSASPR